MGDRGASLPRCLLEAASLPDAENVAAFRSFLERFHGGSIEALLLAQDASLHYPIHVQFAEFLDWSPRLANLLHFRPTRLLPLFDDGAREAQKAAIEAHERRPSMTVKANVHVRLNVHGSAFECPETSPPIRGVRVRHAGLLLTLRGTVIRSGAAKVLEGALQYECTKCKNRFEVGPRLDAHNTWELPPICPSELRPPCSGMKFQPVVGADAPVCRDYQEIKVQENSQTLEMNSMPRSMTVVLQDDLVDAVKAGDDVMVTGSVFANWKPPVVGARCDVQLMLLANHIRTTAERKDAAQAPPDMVRRFEDFWRRFSRTPFAGRNTIVRNVCPQMCGLFKAKLAVALALIGGVQRVDDSGTRVRGDSHLLLVGDPGTGKSQLLRYAAELSHRSVMTTGSSSTTAGLTVAAVKDGGDWALEAGALVLADGGLCCIDDFDRMPEADRVTIHEAMEQQTLSVAKAGIVTTLNTRTTVLGAATRATRCDRAQPLTTSGFLSGPLLSRFDVVLHLSDTRDGEWDRTVSSHLLSERSDGSECGEDGPDAWDMATLRSYIRYVRARFQPSLTSEAKEVIRGYYRRQRRNAALPAAASCGAVASRTTVRMLEGLIRLAQAHARLMFRAQVDRGDALAAVVCVEASMGTSAILDGMGDALRSVGADDPDEEHSEQAEEILSMLGSL